jgi:competence protein ComGF
MEEGSSIEAFAFQASSLEYTQVKAKGEQPMLVWLQ